MDILPLILIFLIGWLIYDGLRGEGEDSNKEKPHRSEVEEDGKLQAQRQEEINN